MFTGITLGFIGRFSPTPTQRVTASTRHYDYGLDRAAGMVESRTGVSNSAAAGIPASPSATPGTAAAQVAASLPPTPLKPAASPQPSQPAPSSVSGPPIAWGLYNPGFPGNFAAIQNAEAKLGKRSAIVMWYKHWGGPYNTFYAPDFEAVLNHGSVPMVTWMSDDYTLPGYPNNSSQLAYTDAKIAAGAFDPFIRSWAVGLRGIGRPVLLRLDHEVNGNWYAWSPGVNGNTAAQYIAMWRHVHDLFTQEGATNVRWVWSPNAGTPFSNLYPGNAYVDWVGLDGYNWGGTNGWTPWQSFTTVFGASYREILALSNRPLMIAETSSVEMGAPAGASKASWIAGALQAEVTQNFPRVRALVWFDQNNGKGQDFRIDSSPASLGALAQALRSSRYSSTFTP
jgi:hypothetical protein